MKGFEMMEGVLVCPEEKHAEWWTCPLVCRRLNEPSHRSYTTAAYSVYLY